MRKYYQLILVIICALSVVSLLLYRHEYNRLRNVLEVLNFFGKAGRRSSSPASDCDISNDSFSLNHSFSESEGAWQRITNTQFVYSAFWEVKNQKRQVKAVAVVVNSTKPQLSCEAWFEDDGQAVKGRFKSKAVFGKEFKQTTDSSASLIVYHFYCEIKLRSSVPYRVMFYKTGEPVPSHGFIPVQYWGNTALSPSRTAICVFPDENIMLTKDKIVEFLSYHQLLGVSDFIVYENVLPRRLKATLSNPLVHEKFGFSVSFLNWNFPFPTRLTVEASRLMVEKDCLLRALGKVQNVMIVSWQDYIVPRYHHLLANMLDDFDSGRKTTVQFEIPLLTLCTDSVDGQQAQPEAPLILRKTHYNKNSAQDSAVYVYRPHLALAGYEAALTTQRVSKGIAAVHRYAKCGLTEQGPDTLTYEPAILRFAADLNKSKLLRMWKSGKLFT